MPHTYQDSNRISKAHSLASLQFTASEAVRRTIYALAGTKFLNKATEAERAALIATTMDISLLLDNFSSRFFIPGEEAAGDDATAWLLELYGALERHRDILAGPGAGQAMFAHHKPGLLAHFKNDVPAHDAPGQAAVAA